MPLPETDTIITYPDGAVASSGTVLHVEPLADGTSAVLLDRTALHPVDTAWPDQPADRGSMLVDGAEASVVDAVTGGIRDGALLLGTDLAVRTGTDGWTFVVAHIVDGPPPAPGAAVQIRVDADYRRALSQAHTACHLAALALDDALADAWTKPATLDALGNPAFDQLAIQSSRIQPNRSTDTYRVGKSLRRKGFDPASLDALDAVAARVNATLASWTAAGGAVSIEREDQSLSARRLWVCELPGGRTRIPCGGTHVTDLRDLPVVHVALALARSEGAAELTMVTTVA